MIVADLRELLEGLPQTHRILIQGYEYGFEDMDETSIRQHAMAINGNGEFPNHAGPHDYYVGDDFLVDSSIVPENCVLLVRKG